MPRLTRRDFLGSAGAAAAFTLLPPSLKNVLAASPPEPLRSLQQIEHVVMLIQENRSFDHYFGSLSGVRGFADKDALGLSTGRSVFYQPDALNPDGYELPFHLDTSKTNAAAIADLSHAWYAQHKAWNGGKMDSWLPAHREADGGNGPLTMGHCTRQDLPFHYALADTFTICDGYHCSVMGPTHPNLIFALTGTNDPDGKGGGPVVDNSWPAQGSFTWTTLRPSRRRRAVHVRRPGSARVPAGRLGQDRLLHHLRRERRLLRPRGATDPATGRARGVDHDPAAPGRGRNRRPERARLPGPCTRHLPVEQRRLGLQRDVRPHLDHPVHGAAVRRHGAEHQRLAPEHVRRSDVLASPGRPGRPDPEAARSESHAQADGAGGGHPATAHRAGGPGFPRAGAGRSAARRPFLRGQPAAAAARGERHRHGRPPQWR